MQLSHKTKIWIGIFAVVTLVVGGGVYFGLRNTDTFKGAITLSIGSSGQGLDAVQEGSTADLLETTACTALGKVKDPLTNDCITLNEAHARCGSLNGVGSMYCTSTGTCSYPGSGCSSGISRSDDPDNSGDEGDPSPLDVTTPAEATAAAAAARAASMTPIPAMTVLPDDQKSGRLTCEPFIENGLIVEDFYVKSNTEVYGFGTSGHIFKWNGTAWSQLTSGTTVGSNMHIVSDTQIYAIGKDSKKIEKWNGASWTPITTSGQIMDDFYLVAENDIYAFGTSQRVFHWNGTGWTVVTDPTVNQALHIATYNGNKNIYAIGADKDYVWVSRGVGNGWTVATTGANGTAYKGMGVREDFQFLAPNNIYAFTIGSSTLSEGGNIVQWIGSGLRMITQIGNLRDSLQVKNKDLVYALGTDKKIYICDPAGDDRKFGEPTEQEAPRLKITSPSFETLQITPVNESTEVKVGMFSFKNTTSDKLLMLNIVKLKLEGTLPRTDLVAVSIKPLGGTNPIGPPTGADSQNIITAFFNPAWDSNGIRALAANEEQVFEVYAKFKPFLGTNKTMQLKFESVTGGGFTLFDGANAATPLHTVKAVQTGGGTPPPPPPPPPADDTILTVHSTNKTDQTAAPQGFMKLGEFTFTTDNDPVDITSLTFYKTALSTMPRANVKTLSLRNGSNERASVTGLTTEGEDATFRFTTPERVIDTTVLALYAELQNTQANEKLAMALDLNSVTVAGDNVTVEGQGDLTTGIFTTAAQQQTTTSNNNNTTSNNNSQNDARIMELQARIAALTAGLANNTSSTTTTQADNLRAQIEELEDELEDLKDKNSRRTPASSSNGARSAVSGTSQTREGTSGESQTQQTRTDTVANAQTGTADAASGGTGASAAALTLESSARLHSAPDRSNTGPGVLIYFGIVGVTQAAYIIRCRRT